MGNVYWPRVVVMLVAAMAGAALAQAILGNHDPETVIVSGVMYAMGGAVYASSGGCRC